MFNGTAVCPKNVVVPVILLPGIMGSRLKSGDKVVWDPDSKKTMLSLYAVNAGSVVGPDAFRIRENKNVREAAAKRKSLLIGDRFDKNFLKPIEFAPVDKLRPDQIERNWSSVSLGSYGEILRQMETTFPHWLTNEIKQINPQFHLMEMPVYACGYNWSASNYDSGKAAAAHIKNWVQKARDYAAENNAQCPGAILVTHSMGGLVARSAALMHGAAEDILAVISVVMPTDGAPAAYKRFHFGFENPGWGLDLGAYLVLGRQGRLVTALLGHMPGAQELLPNKRYVANDGTRKWLHILNPKRGVVGELISGSEGYLHLPESNPYTEIYRRVDRMYRAANPEWLFPEGLANGNPFDEFQKHNEVAEAWHDRIASAGDFHELTFTCHSADRGMLTYDFISWRPDMTAGGLGRSVKENNLKTEPDDTPSYRREHVVWGNEKDKYIEGGYLGFGTDWQITPAAGMGDKTVPISASVLRMSQNRRTSHSPGYEHEASIRTPVVIRWVRERMMDVLSQCELY